MTQQTEKICFRYDGSEEAQEALKWVNEIDPGYAGLINYHYLNLPSIYGIYSSWCKPDTHILVPPAEFLRIVKGESQWTPKYGEEVEGTHLGKPVSGLYLASVDLIHGRKRHILQGKLEQNDLIIATTIRPIRKSLREELSKLIPLINADDIINLFKKYKDEL